MSNQETRFVRCSTDKPVVILSHKVNADALLADSPADILYSETFEYKPLHGDGMSIDLTVMDAPTVGKELNYILSIGGGSPGSEYLKVGELQYTFDTSASEAKQMPLRELHMFTKNENVDPSHHRPQPQNKEEGKSKAKELINKHLDDLIEQAALLKGELDPLERADAYARLHFSMSRLDGLEQTTTYDVRPRFMTRDRTGDSDRRQSEQRRENRYRHGRAGFDVDRVYRQSDDSYYTLDGQFIETSDEATAKAWYGDASPESMERLRRDRDIAERERELNPLNDRDPRGDFRDDRRGGYSRG